MIIQGDSLLLPLSAGSVDMCLTSPPYWGLRDYGTGADQLGLEATPELYIKNMTEIFHGVKRVLKEEGTLWLNIGDTYNSYPHWDKVDYGGVGNKTTHQGKTGTKDLSRKCLCMIPKRLAWSLIQDGWILRNKIIWYKPNAMPSSVKDRFSNKWEHVYLFSKSQKYYFDLDAVREAHKECTIARYKRGWNGDGERGYPNGPQNHMKNFLDNEDARQRAIEIGKNPGDVFEICTQPFPEAHFAVFPEKLCIKPIKAGCPKGGVVLDPFCGAGTTGVVAKEHGCKFIGVDIKLEYCKMAKNRISKSGYQMVL